MGSALLAFVGAENFSTVSTIYVGIHKTVCSVSPVCCLFFGLATLPKKNTQKLIGKMKHKQNHMPNVGMEKIY